MSVIIRDSQEINMKINSKKKELHCKGFKMRFKTRYDLYDKTYL